VFGKDGETHTREVDATSLFEAADTVIRDWNRLWWCSFERNDSKSNPGRIAGK
jgi:hypothetical protein